MESQKVYKTHRCVYCLQPVPGGSEVAVGGRPEAVPLLVPILGWFCSQDCAEAYENAYAVEFRRNSAGRIAYED